MNILILCSGNFPNFSFEKHQSFIFDQVNSVIALNKDIVFHYHFIKGNGIKGYLSNLKSINRKISKYKINLIHAHGGMSGLLANLQRSVSVVTTFHGSDINNVYNRIFSYLAIISSKISIVVSEYLFQKLFIKKNTYIIACGVDTSLFKPRDKEKVRHSLNFDDDKKYILFSSHFSNPVKNYQLLDKAKAYLNSKITIIELEGFNRQEVSKLFNAVDVAVLTSFNEGSPQFIKEAMASNCPIVSVDVGDVRALIEQESTCYISSYNSIDLANKINKVLNSNRKSNGRQFVSHLKSQKIGKKILNVYYELLKS